MSRGAQRETPLWPDVLSARFSPEACIGAGATGAVWRVQERSAGRLCALKVTHPRLAQQRDVQRRFIREAAAVYRLRHPHIVQLHDFFQAEDGTLALVMEYVEGTSMRRLCDDVVPWPQLRRLLLQILDALAFAHGLGVTHRDLKPENVLIGQDALGDPMARLVDFGIARFNGLEEADFGSGVTGFNQLGSPPYAAPEQLIASQYVTTLADIFSFGALAWEVVAGHLPWDVERRTRMELQKLEGEIPRLVQRRGVDAPAELEGILGRCLQPVPLGRFWFAAELRQAIMALPEETDHLLPSTSRAAVGQGPAADTQVIPDPQRRVEAGEHVALHTGALLIGPDARRFVREPAFVGREQAREALRTRVAEVLAEGRVAGAWIRGPSGQGKTRLVRWLRSALTVDAAMVVIHLHMDPKGVGHALRRSVLELFGCDPALQSGRSWLRETVRNLGVEGAARDRVIRLLEDADPGRPADDWHAWGTLLEKLARQHPLCVVLDSVREDALHEVAQLFEWTYRALGRRRVPFFLVCAVTTPVGASAPDWSAIEAEGLPLPADLLIEAMPEEEMEQMLRCVDASSDLRQEILRCAAGSPMLATELLYRGEMAEGPAIRGCGAALRSALLIERLQNCRHPSLYVDSLLELLKGLSIGPSHVPLEMLDEAVSAAGLALPPRRLHLQLRTLCELRVLVSVAGSEGGGYAFRSEFWRETAAALMRSEGGAERWARAWLAASQGPSPKAATLALRARLHGFCGQTESAHDALLDATERALASGELRRALELCASRPVSVDSARRSAELRAGLLHVRVLERLGALSPALDLSAQLVGRATCQGGDWAALVHVRHARLRVETGADERGAALVDKRLLRGSGALASTAAGEYAALVAEGSLARGDDERCLHQIEEGIDLLGMQLDSLGRAEVLLRFARLLFLLGENERAFQICEQVHSWAVRADVPLAVALLSLELGLRDLATGNCTDGRRRALRALRFFGASGDRRGEAFAELLLAGVEVRAGNAQRAARRVARVRHRGQELDTSCAELLALLEEATGATEPMERGPNFLRFRSILLRDVPAAECRPRPIFH